MRFRRPRPDRLARRAAPRPQPLPGGQGDQECRGLVRDGGVMIWTRHVPKGSGSIASFASWSVRRIIPGRSLSYSRRVIPWETTSDPPAAADRPARRASRDCLSLAAGERRPAAHAVRFEERAPRRRGRFKCSARRLGALHAPADRAHLRALIVEDAGTWPSSSPVRARRRFSVEVGSGHYREERVTPSTPHLARRRACAAPSCRTPPAEFGTFRHDLKALYRFYLDEERRAQLAHGTVAPRLLGGLRAAEEPADEAVAEPSPGPPRLTHSMFVGDAHFNLAVRLQHRRASLGFILLLLLLMLELRDKLLVRDESRWRGRCRSLSCRGRTRRSMAGRSGATCSRPTTSAPTWSIISPGGEEDRRGPGRRGGEGSRRRAPDGEAPVDNARLLRIAAPSAIWEPG